MRNAATYCRSSKDRKDVSISAQDRELEKLAEQRNLQIVRRYEDAVESGSNENRPGFTQLVRDIKNPKRGWDYLLVYDTSRIARRRYIAQAIKHEAKKRGVTILYSRLPSDLDPIAELVLVSVFEAWDEAHSLMSRDKGLAGMAENVRQGWRAGGRAPTGYRLEGIPTGAIREGRPVVKSRLAAGDRADAVRAYLSARAAGIPRSRARRLLPLSPTSLIGLEWNALTYAGHTVWNVHAEPGSGSKRRPRSQWVIQRNTHPALISDAQAETLLAQLETSRIGQAVSRGKQAVGSALLGGLLRTSEGQIWVSHGTHYRLRRSGTTGPGKLLRAELIDTAVIEQVRSDCESDIYLAQLAAAVKQQYRAGPVQDLLARIRRLEREKARAAELSLMDSAFVELVVERSRQIDALRREAEACQQDELLERYVRNISVATLRELLADRDPAERIQMLVDHITLDPDLSCKLHYRSVPGQAGGDLPNPRGDATDSHHPTLVRVLRLVA